LNFLIGLKNDLKAKVEVALFTRMIKVVLILVRLLVLLLCQNLPFSPTIVSYNTSVVKIYNGTSFENKIETVWVNIYRKNII
jgi:hypothetical protein